MIKEDETLASPDPLDGEFLPWQGRSFEVGDDDASPVPSPQFSSYGESEFDKYCSANSVMGTPSLCSSIGTFQDFQDSVLGSSRSFRLGGDENGLENFSLGGSFDGNLVDNKPLSLSECSQKNDSFNAKIGSEMRNEAESEQRLTRVESGLSSCDEMGSPSELLAVSDLNSAFDVILKRENDKGSITTAGDCNNSEAMPSSFDNESNVKKGNSKVINAHVVNTGVGGAGLEEGSQFLISIEEVGSGFEGLTSQSGMEVGGSEGGRCSDEGETSSRYEHSEGEDSMYGYGTDNEKQDGLLHRGYLQYQQEAHGKNENTLLMNSSIAFGVDDWDDFMQETMEIPKVSFSLDELQRQKQQGTESLRDNLEFTSATPTECPCLDVPEKQEDVKDIPISNQVQIPDDLAVYTKSCSINRINHLMDGDEEQEEIVKDKLVTANQVVGFNLLNAEQDSRTKEALLTDGLKIRGGGLDKEPESTSTKDSKGITADHVTLSPVSMNSNEATEDRIAEMFQDHKSYPLQSLSETKIKRMPKDTPTLDLFEDHPRSIKTKNHELNDFYDEIVHEMEEILLDSGESPAARFSQGNKIHHSMVPLPLRDGGSTASTSSMDDTFPLIRNSLRIDGVEVVGARQIKGDVSLSERLVGVKEYTVYKLRVWSGNDQWEVERRYRDFFTLYRRLKTSFANQGWVLPAPWLSVERESRKFFGNASPDVIAERSVLIQECLQSILQFRFSSSHPSSLIWFLSPSKVDPTSPALDTHTPRSPFSTRGMDTETIYPLGQSISLVVEIRPYKSMGQMLEAQRYTCAGCHKHFDDGKTWMWEFVQTLGWGKPRFCEYSGQLFCSSCHTNETAVLPARVLRLWDFTEYPVSQLAKSYLDSIYDQPMLCVSAVNPFLFSKVPALQHVTNLRKRIGVMLPYVRCPFRRSIYNGLGSRRYILESNDFFALKDLIDLSKGVFAALPVMVETVSRRILEHITDRCLICCDSGVPCNARQACADPSSLIFPFQEGEVERCRSCGLVFHKHCFEKIASCPCGALQGTAAKGSAGVSNEVVGTLDFWGGNTDSKSFLAGLFSKTKATKLWGPRTGDNVILMGSLPSTSL